MHLGIDFGTTRTVVAAVDRGNYPVVNFQAKNGDFQPWFPTLIAKKEERCFYGFDVQEAGLGDDVNFLRSPKRMLTDVGKNSLIFLEEQSISALDLLTEFFKNLYQALYHKSSLKLSKGETLETFVSVPANYNSHQRFITIEAFQRAGFNVTGLLNEPTAAGIEYTYRYGLKKDSGTKDYLVIYDLGSGMFDASVIAIKNHQHEVVANEVISYFGGDDFDQILLSMALEKSGEDRQLSDLESYLMLKESRLLKESLHPNTRKIRFDLRKLNKGLEHVEITVKEFYEHCIPLVEMTMKAMEMTIEDLPEGKSWKDVSSIYVVGGSSPLPIIPRYLRTHYRNMIKKSPYPFASTAIGLAIGCDPEQAFKFKEIKSNYFGVWREAESGRKIIFDPVFSKGITVPDKTMKPLISLRRYHPVHNIAHFRYLEGSSLGVDGQPSGDMTPWDEIFFPVDPGLRSLDNLRGIEIKRSAEAGEHEIEERYIYDSKGVIEVTLADLKDGYERTYQLRRSA